MNDSGLNAIEKAPLIELAQFVLNRNTENVRDELHNYLVELALLNNPQGITRDEIGGALEKTFGFSEFPMPIVDSALYRLGNELKIQGHPPRYFISTARRNELAEMFGNQKMLRDYFLARVLTKIENDYGEISDVESNNVVTCLFEFLGIAFNNMSINLARLISEKPEEVKDVTELLEVDEMLTQSFESIQDSLLARNSIQAIKDVLVEYDEKTSIFLYSLAQSYALLKILNIDPECLALQKKEILSDMVIYLDTNFVINLLCEKASPRIHNSNVRLVKLNNQLGIQCVISTRTTKEVERHLQAADEEYQNIGDVPEHRRKKLFRYVGDELIREYWMQLRSMPALKWTAFLGRLRNFSSILRNKHSVTIDKKVYDHIASSSKFNELSKLIREANPEKSSEVIEHDCYHLLLIDHLRDEASDGVIIPKRWFLTIDKTLGLVEKMKMVTERKRPSSVLPHIWLHMISPLLSPKVATKEASKVFSRCFSKELVPSFPRIRPVLLTKLVGPCLDHTDLDLNEIKEIIGDSYLREHFEEMGNKKVEVYLANKLLGIREKTHKKEMQQAEEEKATLLGKVARLEKENRETLEMIDTGKHFGRYLAGGGIFLAVWIVTYVLVLLPTIKDGTVACVLSIFVSLIFGYLLGFRRYEWILERFSDLVGALKNLKSD